MAASNRYGSRDSETERTVMINIQKEEQHKRTYRLLAVAAIGIWFIVSVVILVKPSLFREQEGYYLYDDRILYYQDYRWYEYSGSKWIETEEDIEKKEGIWSYKVSFTDIRDEEPDIREISLARIWMEQ